MEPKFNSSGQIQVKGDEIIIALKSEPRHGKANKELIRKNIRFLSDLPKIAYVSFLD